MATSARLSAGTEQALKRYCKRHGITKTEALERGIGLLDSEPGGKRHPAWIAFEHVRSRLPVAAAAQTVDHSAELKRHLDAKYPA